MIGPPVRPQDRLGHAVTPSHALPDIEFSRRPGPSAHEAGGSVPRVLHDGSVGSRCEALPRLEAICRFSVLSIVASGREPKLGVIRREELRAIEVAVDLRQQQLVGLGDRVRYTVAPPMTQTSSPGSRRPIGRGCRSLGSLCAWVLGGLSARSSLVHAAVQQTRCRSHDPSDEAGGCLSHGSRTCHREASRGCPESVAMPRRESRAAMRRIMSGGDLEVTASGPSREPREREGSPLGIIIAKNAALPAKLALERRPVQEHPRIEGAAVEPGGRVPCGSSDW